MSAAPPRKRVAVLISGGGSNMRALVEAARAADYPAEIALVMSNRPGAGSLAYARDAGIPTKIIDHKIHAHREDFERSMHAMLELHHIEIVCLAGFMRLLSPWFVGQWQGRMLNIHPALLPAYKGLNTHARALADGAKTHGCTVHFVVSEMDAGPVILQASVPVLAGDTAQTLAARVLAEEHRIYPQALAQIARAGLISPLV